MEEEDSGSRNPGGVWVDEKEEEEVSRRRMKSFLEEGGRGSGSRKGRIQRREQGGR